MKLIYTGDFERLKEFRFNKVADFYIREYQEDTNISYYDKNFIRIRCLNGYSLYRQIQNCGKDRIGFVHVDYENTQTESLIEDLIRAGLVKKEEE